MRKTKLIICLFLTLALVMPMSMVVAADDTVNLGNMFGSTTFADNGTVTLDESTITKGATGVTLAWENLADGAALKVSGITDTDWGASTIKRIWFGEMNHQYLVSAKVKAANPGATTGAFFEGSSSGASKSKLDDNYKAGAYNYGKGYAENVTADGWTEIYALYALVENDSTKTMDGVHIEIRLTSATDVYIKDFNVVETSEVDNLLLGELDPTFENTTELYTTGKTRYDVKASGSSIIKDEDNTYLELTGYTAHGFGVACPVSAGKKYIAAMDVKVPSTDTNTYTASFSAPWGTADNKVVTQGISSTISGSDWNRIACSIVPVASESLYVYLEVNGYTGAVLVDNIEFYEIANDTGNILNDKNLSFELGAASGIGYTGTYSVTKGGTDGNYCAKIVNRTSQSVAGTFKYKNITVEPGAIYELSADIKLVENLSSLNAVVYVDLVSGTPLATGETNYDESEKKTVTNSGWTTVKKLFAVNQSGCTTVDFGLQLLNGSKTDRTSGGIMVDNLVMRKVGEISEITPVGSNTGTLVKYLNKVAVSINPSEEKDVYMFVCEYDEEGNLTKVKSILSTDNVPTGGGTFTYAFESTDEMANARLYLWEKDTFMPLCEKITME